MLNIPLLEATRASILCENNPFDMGDWCCCIAGHAFACYSGERVTRYSSAMVFDGGAAIADLLGLEYNYARWLFCQGFTRYSAAEFLSVLIKERIDPANITQFSQIETADICIYDEEILEEELVCV